VAKLLSAEIIADRRVKALFSKSKDLRMIINQSDVEGVADFADMCLALFDH
jgi:hypothetical protein